MKKLTSLIFLTFVLGPLALIAAPHSEAPEAITDEPQTQSSDPELMQNTVVSDVPGSKNKIDQLIERFDRRDYYHAYRQNLRPYLGVLFPVVDSTEDDPDKDSKVVNLMVGFSWELPKRLAPKWELGAAWSTLSYGQMNFTHKHIYNEKGAFRPFYRYGLTLKIDPDEQFANVSDTDNILLRLGVGFEDIIKPPRSVRLDMDLAVGEEDLWLMFNYGYAWGW